MWSLLGKKKRGGESKVEGKIGEPEPLKLWSLFIL